MTGGVPADERYEPGEPTLNYALREYNDGFDAAGLLHPSNLLYESFRGTTVEAAAAELFRRTRAEFGRSGTAWGVKSVPGRPLSWELYYYQHSCRTSPLVLLTTSRVADLLAEWGISTDAAPQPPIKRFSVSFDLDTAILNGEASSAIHAYLDQGQTSPPSAMSYRLGPHGLEFENVYLLCRQNPPNLEMPRQWFFTSLHVDQDRVHVDEVLWPEMLECDHLALAHKPGCEGVYFGGVTVEQLERFFDRVDFNPLIVEYVKRNRDRLGHLRYDVGFDFKYDATAGLQILRSAVYGAL